MTRKDYVKIAEVLREVKRPVSVEMMGAPDYARIAEVIRAVHGAATWAVTQIAYDMAYALQAVDPQFDMDGFLIACGMGGS